MHCQIRDYENSTKFEPINTVYFYISLKSSRLLNLESDSKSYHPISDFFGYHCATFKKSYQPELYYDWNLHVSNFQ